MKYLIVKGWLGFGDRLESTIMAIKYAIDNNLQIYIDWTDNMWSHSGENFYTYFNLINMPTLKSIDDIPEDATVFPPFWKGHLKDTLTQDMINNQKDNEINLGVLDKQYNADVVVFCTIGNRIHYGDYSFFANVFRIKDPRIVQEVRARQARYNLANTIGIHIRGTDRVRSQIKRERSIQFMAIRAITYGGFSAKPMISVSDDKNSEEIWKRFFPQTISLSDLSLKVSNQKGNHNVSSDELGVSKDLMNVDMLVDLFTLASCERVLTTYKDSRFAAVASRLHPHINTMLS